MGHMPILVENVDDALDAYIHMQPDLVILDVVMSGKDGYECALELRKIQGDDEWVPIIFLSSKIEDEDIVKGIESGGDDYLPKPFREKVFRATILAMERISKMRKELVIAQTYLHSQNVELKELSLTDGLTDLSNRRAFDRCIETEWQRFQRVLNNAKAWALLMVDIDFFKQYNDTYGHQAGDTCLQQVASKIHDIFQHESDFVFRYGGEEFVIVLPNFTNERVKELAETLRSGVEALKLPHENSSALSVVTISVGASVMTKTSHPETYEGLIKCADDALYEAKEKGRNRVVFCDKCS